MAIKIITSGQKIFTAFCDRCGCEFTYELDDLKLSCSSDKVACPTCGKDYYHKPLSKTTVEPYIKDISWPPDPIPCTPDMSKTDPCAGCAWREKLFRDGVYVGDSPCTWCSHNRFNTITAPEFTQKFEDYTTLCGVKAPEAYISGVEKASCHCDETSTCNICSGVTGVTTLNTASETSTGAARINCNHTSCDTSASIKTNH